jgi:hypothetical protein
MGSCCRLLIVLAWCDGAFAFLAANPPCDIAGASRLRGGLARARAAVPVAAVMAEGASSPERRHLLRTTGGALAGAVTAAVLPREAGAICGAKPASWEFWIPWNEELVSVGNSGNSAKSGKRSVFYRVVGDIKNENGSKDKGDRGKRHLMLVVPDKFKDHEYLTTLEALVTSDRRVVLYDAMGTGQSEPLPPAQREELQADEEKALAFAVSELADMWSTLKKELKVDQVHVFGHGFGARVANEFAKANPGAVTSLVLASPPDSLGKPEAKQVIFVLACGRSSPQYAPCFNSNSASLAVCSLSATAVCNRY